MSKPKWMLRSALEENEYVGRTPLRRALGLLGISCGWHSYRRPSDGGSTWADISPSQLTPPASGEEPTGQHPAVQSIGKAYLFALP